MGCRAAVLAVSVAGALSTAVAQQPAFDWVTIGNPGNAPYMGTPGNATEAENYGLIGRGQVNYTYSMARTELTHEQYLPFYNMLASHPDHPVATMMRNTWGLDVGPTLLGFMRDESYSGPGNRFMIAYEGAGQWPVFGLSWRLAAVYVNWLNNGCQNDPSTITSGAYDISTFNNSVNWTDQVTHSPGARYWIPTLDEWIKAAHYDPNRFGPDQGGYWLYPTGSDAQPMPGLPQNGGQYYNGIGSDEPVGMYPGSASHYGLLDMAGGAEEWTEGVRQTEGGPRGRYAEGGNLTSPTSVRLDIPGGAFPFDFSYQFGLRIASNVPSPGSGMLLLVGGASLLRRRSRYERPHTR